MLQNEVSYTGAISDSTTGLTYMNARYYNPAIGSFTSQDTYYGSAYSPWAQHLYSSYTGGNPINFIDPNGHLFIENNGGGAAVTLGPMSAISGGPGGTEGLGAASTAVVVVATFIVTVEALNYESAREEQISINNYPSSPPTNNPSTITNSGSSTVTTPSPTYNAGDNYTLSPTEPIVEPVVYIPNLISARSILDSLAFAKKIPSKLLTSEGKLNLSLFNNPNGQKQPKGGRSILGPM